MNAVHSSRKNMDVVDNEQQIIVKENGEEFSIDMQSNLDDFEMNRTRSTVVAKPSISSASSSSKPTAVTSAKALLDGKFFSVAQEFYDEGRNQRRVKKIRGKCSLCAKPTFITCSYDSTSNFLRHIRLKHGKQIYESYLAYKKAKALNLNPSALNQFVIPQTTNVQHVRDTRNNVEVPSLDKVQKLVDRFQIRLLKFMINSMQPLSLVDNSYFRDLFPGVLTPMVSSSAVASKIENLFDDCRIRIKNLLSNVKYVCLTADIWAEKMDSFIGFTSHWMNDNFIKESAVLACNRLLDVSVDNFVNCIDEILNIYNLNREQIVVILLNNSFNYTKALQNLKIKSFDVGANGSHSLIHNNSIGNGDFDETSDDTNLHFLEVETEYLTVIANSRNIYQILNSITIVDYKFILINYEEISKLHDSAIEKCNLLWCEYSKATMKAKITSIVGCKLSLPSPLNWKLLYDAIKIIIEIQNTLPKLCQELNMEEFSPEEIDYLHTYVTVMNPLAAAMETLAGENVFFGFVLPTLLTVKMKLEEKCKNTESYAGIIANSMLEHFQVRFEKYLNLDTTEICVQQAILAAVSHPKLKMRWISNVEKNNEIKQLFVEECSNLTQESESHVDEIEDDDFFSACLHSKDEITIKNETKSNAELEVLRFIASKDKSMEMLHSYPSVKLVFLKYNCLLSSSLPVEKLFSFESLINRDTIATAKLQEFQTYMFLKGNSSLIL